MRPTINTVKHYVQTANTLIASAGISVNTIAAAVANTALPVNTFDVKEGSKISAFYVEMWYKGAGASDADTQFNVAIYKNPQGSETMTASNLLNMMAYDNKRNIIFASQGVIGGIGGGQAIPAVRQWFKIPKGKQRMGLKDSWQIAFTTTGEGCQKCGVFVYKEQQ